MPILKVIWQERLRTIPFKAGPSLREILDATDVRVRSGCRGNGSCGLCLVRIEEGTLDGPTENERLSLTPEQLTRGVRFACQAIPRQDVRIRIVNPAPASCWKSPAADEYFLPSPPPEWTGEPGGRGPSSLGVAVDLGTTHVTVTLWDRDSGRRLAGRSGLNQQFRFGTDVMTRIMAAAESPASAAAISRLAVDSIGEALFDIAAREGFDLGGVAGVAIVGNTAELALLAARNHGLLLQPKFWTRPIDCRPADTAPWHAAWGIPPGAAVEVIPPLAGFVGSDLLAGVLATGMTARSRAALLIDFGTNSEIALWDGSRLWVTSAAGGPAFEGCGLSCGMPAESGAIYRVEGEEASPHFALHVIDDAAPRGLCGSGLVDLIASLVRTGVLNARGKFTAAPAEGGFSLPAGGRDIRLTGRDVDLFQRAKAAIGAGIRILLQSAALTTREIDRLYVCGAFGRFLNVAHARGIGLLPPVGEAAIELCGNTALAGCELLLTAPARRTELDAIRRGARLVNMAQRDDFEAYFVENLYLTPMEAD
jgi:uncharacterized 2Fe-2S/4Fe-4S cluster protein (DUF4445 family)